MNKFIKHIFIACLLLATKTTFAQELNCQVLVTSAQLSGADNLKVFAAMQVQVNDFMNNYRFTKDKFEVNEKIDCEVTINVSTDLGSGAYQGTIQVLSRRPIFKAGINSTLLDMQDKQFQFTYNMGQSMIFSLQSFDSNLTSVLAYYAYVIIATDYDSFSLLGGTEFWKNAQTITNNAQSATEPGWLYADNGLKNRYIYIDNLMNPLFQPLRETMYNYHRKGMDMMYDNLDGARAAVFQALSNINEVSKSRPGSYNVQTFFEAKNQEIVQIFQSSTNTDEKNQLITLLGNIDAANTTIYSKIISP
ncbi:MAG: DUF4835 family protein [Bacteroidia bacterium]